MKFPTMQSTGNISTNIAQPQKSSVDFTPLIKAGGEVAQQWQQAKDTAETNEAYNNLEIGQAKILQKAQLEPDYKNEQTYLDELEELRGSQDFSNPQLGAKFQRVSDSSINNATIKMNSMFRNKLIKNQQGEVVKTQDIQKNSYMKGDPTSKDINSGVLKESLDKGFITPAYYNKSVEAMKGWEFERAELDVSTNPQYVLDNIDGYSIDQREKSKIIKDATNILDTFKSLEENTAGAKDDLMQEAIRVENTKIKTDEQFSLFSFGSTTKDGSTTYKVKNPKLNNIESVVEFRNELKNNKDSFTDPKTGKVSAKFISYNSDSKKALYDMARQKYGEQDISEKNWFAKDEYNRVGNNVLSNIDFRVDKDDDESINFKADLYEDTITAISMAGLDLESENTNDVKKAQKIANDVYLTRLKNRFNGLGNLSDDVLLKTGTYKNLELDRKRAIIYPSGKQVITRQPQVNLTEQQKVSNDIFKSIGL